MIQIDDKKQCCGCTACESICPKNAIKMLPDSEGFLYPETNSAICVECGLCEKVCPMKNKYDDSVIPRSVVARDVRSDVLKNGTSGSMFTSIMEYVLGNHGIIYGVIIDKENIVRHIRVESLKDPNVKKIPGSKYCRSEINGIFGQIKKDLNARKLVCFSGTPCQVAGLKSFLRTDYDNLITVDVICHGTPSPIFWKHFVEYNESRFKSKIKDVRFRNKTYGYHSGTMKIEFENGEVQYSSARVNYYLKAFFADLISRPSCYECHFKHMQHKSDLTLYDSWHSALLTGIKDDDKGFTNILVQTKKGEEILNNLATVDTYQVDTMRAIKLDGKMVLNSVRWNKDREIFFMELEKQSFYEVVQKYLPISQVDYAIEISKTFLYKTGLIKIAKSIKQYKKEKQKKREIKL